jgi:predicted glycogen debranching enzyme
MSIQFGREICGDLAIAQTREWLVTNGAGGFASGTVSGNLTRRYHGLLIAALQPPLARTLLVSKLDETVHYDDQCYELATNGWGNGTIRPQGYQWIESFELHQTIPTWTYAIEDALLEKRIWMQQGVNTTYVHYSLKRATRSLTLSLDVLVNYRDYHSDTRGYGWQMTINPVERGLEVTAFAGAIPFYIFSDTATLTPQHDWYFNFDLPQERERGLRDREDHLRAATLTVTLNPGENVTIVFSTERKPSLNGANALKHRQGITQQLLDLWQATRSTRLPDAPPWIADLVLAADQFIVNRPTLDHGMGKTVMAGYPWFSDWGRDTMISLPGLALSTGRPDIARSILRTFAHFLSEGMLPNRFPDAGEVPEYNTVDATLWYFEAIRLYYEATDDEDLVVSLFPVLADIIDWYCRGTRFNIHLDPADGLLYAGESASQLTWMDAKVGNWVITPRIGKPIEVNCLWYSALRTMARFSRLLGKPHQEYEAIADRTLARFNRFWNPDMGYCFDVLDGEQGDDPALRPNQILTVSLPLCALRNGHLPLLNFEQQRSVVEACGRSLLTSYGLRSLAPDHPQYRSSYRGDPLQRDSAYHQGTVWGWLIGSFAIAHYRVFKNLPQAFDFLRPMANHLTNAGVGNLSEIFDGAPPHHPNGCIAQAWTVAEVLRAWYYFEQESLKM